VDIMARLPNPGGDDGAWGVILNDYLSQSLNSDGSVKNIPQSKITNLDSSLASKASSDNVITNTGGGKDTVYSGNISGSTTVDLGNGNVQFLTLVGDVTDWTINGATNGVACSAELFLIQDGTGSRTATLNSWKWQGGIVPTLSSSPSAVDRFVIITLDGGATIYADVIGLAYA
jgi:hypothetical protein